ncbi:MAG: DUF1385 domain-containing protein [Clostridia bacterium]|jgi:Predicted metal-dependent enzyme|nr:DUF1385 domain-containing protein [Clostridia bacterium]
MEKHASCKKTTIAGQALIEGILMRGPRKTAVVCRRPGEEPVVKLEPTGTMSHGAWARIPVIRGVVSFWDSMRLGIRALTYSADFLGEDEPEEPGRFERWLNDKLGNEKMEKAAMGAALFLGIALPVVLFILLPTLLAGLIGDSLPSLARNLIEGCFRIVIFLTFLYFTSRQKDVHRTYMYHGAEHKTIACYESGRELTVENARDCSRFHPRCGTSFLFMVMLVSILFFSLFSWSNPLVRVITRLALLPVVAGISYEINRFAGRHDNGLTNALRAPGLALQRLTTAEPDDSMLEVAILAMEQVIPENETEDRW